MNTFTADAANLDQPTPDYLSEVSRPRGKGAPGQFVAAKTNIWPVLSLIGGGLVLLVGLILAFGSHKAPWATAMLVTAIVLVGGWMIAYPFRRWFGGGFGHFQYFDPRNAYSVNGREVTVTPIGELINLTIEEHFSNGNYAHTNLHFILPGGKRTFVVADRRKAEQVAGFLNVVNTLSDEKEWSNVAELGATAKYIVKNNERPAGTSDLALDILDVPESPAASSTTGFALRGLMIVAAAAGIFLASWALLSPVQDDVAFADAKQHGVQGYRDYLLDDRHTRHRDEAKAKVAESYQPLIANLATCPNDDEKKGWTDLLETLSKFEGLPVVSIAVTEEGTVDVPEAREREKQMRTWLADSLGSKFGPTMVAFVEPPTGVKPHIEVVYRNLYADQRMTWQVKFRATPESEPLVGPEHSIVNRNAISFGYPPLAFQQAFHEQTFKGTVPTIHTAPVGGGDFSE